MLANPHSSLKNLKLLQESNVRLSTWRAFAASVALGKVARTDNGIFLAVTVCGSAGLTKLRSSDLSEKCLQRSLPDDNETMESICY
jgi:hypothetical protein